MKNLEDFVKPTQLGLYNLLSKKFRAEATIHVGYYILVPGKAPIMLIAHLDTVHKKPVEHICKSFDGNILMSPQGIGGDDRCGVYALMKTYEAAPVKPWLLFTCHEETGGLGAEKFAMDYNENQAPKRFGKLLPRGINKMKLLIEIDRKGNNEAVYYDCDNPDLEAYITSKGYKTAIGSFSDISIIAPAMGVAAVNLSAGYYNAHTLYEYINRKEIEATIQAVKGIVSDAAKPDFPKYKYIERSWPESFNGQYNVRDTWEYRNSSHIKRSLNINSQPVDLPPSWVQIYNDLLEIYSSDELEWYRKEYGDQIICQLYNNEFGPFFSTNKEEQ